MTTPAERLRALTPQPLALLLVIRIAAAATAVVLLSVHEVTPHDGSLMAAVAAYTVITAAAAWSLPSLIVRPAAWLVDALAVITLVWLTDDWRSPVYLLAVTTVATPAAALRPIQGLGIGAAFSSAYFIVSLLIGPDPLHVGPQRTVETAATQLVLPLLLAFGVSYAADTVRSLQAERRRAERLAIEAERRRIAWELHDFAKQRLHAAHLVLDSVAPPADDESARAIEQVLSELRLATADMDSSVAELRSPLERRPLRIALMECRRELTVGGGPTIRVQGDLDDPEPLEAAHAYRIAAEAMTNAVRQAHATRIDVALATYRGTGVVVVSDNGPGIPSPLGAGANGVRAMRNRAATIGGELTIEPRSPGPGTRVELRFPRSARSPHDSLWGHTRRSRTSLSGGLDEAAAALDADRARGVARTPPVNDETPLGAGLL